MKPRLFLDVDGVLAGAKENTHWKDWRIDPIMGLLIAWSPTVATTLVKLSEQIDICWLTTWEYLADRYLAPIMGFPHWPQAGERGNEFLDFDDHWWKLRIVQEAWEGEHRRFVWIDDDIVGSRAARKWLAGLPAGSALAIAPQSSTGLVPAHLRRVEQFLDLPAPLDDN